VRCCNGAVKQKRLLTALACGAAILCLTTAHLSGEAPSVACSPATSAPISTDSGGAFNLTNRNDRLQKVGLRPGQVIHVALTFPSSMGAQIVSATALDGGSASLASRGRIANGGTLSLQFRAGTAVGLYRVFVNRGDDGQILEFWVRDLINIQNNPLLFSGS
jgi:hypothetical protein